MKKKTKNLKLMAVLLCGTLLISCNNYAASQSDPKAQIESGTEISADNSENESAIEITQDMITYDTDDYYSNWKEESPNYIKMEGDTAIITGSGAAADGGNIAITAGGVYVISGKMENGQILVDTEEKEIVKLVLNGMEIHYDKSAPIFVKNAEKVIISLEEGTENFVTDGENYVFPDAETDEPNAAIFSKADLTINGNGTLTIRGNYNNGITSKDDLRITGGNIIVYSADDGLMGKDKVLIKEGNITIEANGDGIKSTNDTDSDKGFIVIEGGTFDITAGADGIQAETSILINGGEFNISSGGGSINGSTHISNNRQKPFEKSQENTIVEPEVSEETESESGKAIKADLDITINGGNLVIDSADDALHSNNSVTIEDGDITITSGDDGIHGDSSIDIKNGEVNITKSYEGIESALISIEGGNTYVVAQDDGVNVAGGNDGSSIQGRPGQNTFSSSGDNKLNISGGFISVDSSGDGLDANGSIYMTDGTVIVNGPTNNGNGALDYDGEFQISGGILVAAGSSGMAQAPTEESAQYSIIMNYSETQQADTLVHLEDSKGDTVVTFAPQKEYQSVVISSPKLEKDEEYTLYSGGSSTGSESEGFYTDGVYQDGTKIVDFTISNIVTWLNEEGETTSREFGPGGFHNPGMGRKPEDGDRVRP